MRSKAPKMILKDSKAIELAGEGVKQLKKVSKIKEIDTESLDESDLPTVTGELGEIKNDYVDQIYTQANIQNDNKQVLLEFEIINRGVPLKLVLYHDDNVEEKLGQFAAEHDLTDEAKEQVVNALCSCQAIQPDVPDEVIEKMQEEFDKVAQTSSKSLVILFLRDLAMGILPLLALGILPILF